MFDIDEIKSIPIAAVAGDLGFRLSASGGGRCRLPGHQDHNPSFSLRGATNTFRCFACNRSGSVIDLVIEMLGLDFRGACQWLSERYLSGYAEAARPWVHRQARQPSTKTLGSPSAPLDPEVAPDPEVYSWILERSPLRHAGQSYMEHRGIRPATLARFRVGQIDDSCELFRSTSDRFGQNRLMRCGLTKAGRWGDELVFPTGYLLFPFVVRGVVTYLQARRTDADHYRRWICLAKLPPPIFNVDVMTPKNTTITICEGVTDVLSAYELGMPALGFLGAGGRFDAGVFASLEGHNVAVVGDADPAGSAFARRLVRELGARGITAVTKRLPAGCNDLNDYLRARPKSAA
jgi:DNA primase